MVVVVVVVDAALRAAAAAETAAAAAAAATAAASLVLLVVAGTGVADAESGMTAAGVGVGNIVLTSSIAASGNTGVSVCRPSKLFKSIRMPSNAVATAKSASAMFVRPEVSVASRSFISAAAAWPAASTAAAAALPPQQPPPVDPLHGAHGGAVAGAMLQTVMVFPLPAEGAEKATAPVGGGVAAAVAGGLGGGVGGVVGGGVVGSGVGSGVGGGVGADVEIGSASASASAVAHGDTSTGVGDGV